LGDGSWESRPRYVAVTKLRIRFRAVVIANFRLAASGRWLISAAARDVAAMSVRLATAAASVRTLAVRGTAVGWMARAG
jgi:hypothetical protein